MTRKNVRVTLKKKTRRKKRRSHKLNGMLTFPRSHDCWLMRQRLSRPLLSFHRFAWQHRWLPPTRPLLIGSAGYLSVQKAKMSSLCTRNHLSPILHLRNTLFPITLKEFRNHFIINCKVKQTGYFSYLQLKDNYWKRLWLWIKSMDSISLAIYSYACLCRKITQQSGELFDRAFKCDLVFFCCIIAVLPLTM